MTPIMLMECMVIMILNSNESVNLRADYHIMLTASLVNMNVPVK